MDALATELQGLSLSRNVHLDRFTREVYAHLRVMSHETGIVFIRDKTIQSIAHAAYVEVVNKMVGYGIPFRLDIYRVEAETFLEAFLVSLHSDEYRGTADGDSLVYASVMLTGLFLGLCESQLTMDDLEEFPQTMLSFVSAHRLWECVTCDDKSVGVLVSGLSHLCASRIRMGLPEGTEVQFEETVRVLRARIVAMGGAHRLEEMDASLRVECMADSVHMAD